MHKIGFTEEVCSRNQLRKWSKNKDLLTKVAHNKIEIMIKHKSEFFFSLHGNKVDEQKQLFIKLTAKITVSEERIHDRLKEGMSVAHLARTRATHL